MPTAVSETDTYTAALQVPNDGEDVNQASLLSNFVQGLGNRTLHLKNKTPGVGATYQIEIPLGSASLNIGTRFAFLESALLWQQTSVADGGALYFPLPLMAAYGTLKEVHLIVDGGSTHGGVPATKPKITIMRNVATIGAASITAPASVGTATDSSASVGSYELVHAISVTGLAVVPTDINTHWLKVEGETGANSVANELRVLRAYAVVGP